MTETGKSIAAVVGRTVNSGAVAPGVVAACQIAGIATGSPELGMAAGVVAGSAVGSVAEELTLAIHRLWAYRLERVEQLAETTAAEAGVGFDQIILDVSTDAQKLELLGVTVRAASEALDRRKIDLLAHVFVRDVWDCAAIDEAQLLLDSIRQIVPTFDSFRR